MNRPNPLPGQFLLPNLPNLKHVWLGFSPGNNGSNLPQMGDSHREV